MYDTNYINNLIIEIQLINNKITIIDMDTDKIITEHNLHFTNLDIDITAIHKNIRQIQKQLKSFFTLSSKYNNFYDIINRIEANIHHSEKQLILNDKLLTYNNINNYSSQLFQEKPEEEKRNNEKYQESDDYYNEQYNYYNELSHTISKNIAIISSASNNNANEIKFFLDTDTVFLNNLINIIKYRSSLNINILKKYNEKNYYLNNYLHEYTKNLKYFDIYFNDYFDDIIAKLYIFSSSINIKENMSHSKDILNKSNSFSLKLSDLKNYYTFLNNFFNDGTLMLMLNNYHDKSIIYELNEIIATINKNFDFDILKEYCNNTIDIIKKIAEKHEYIIELFNDNYLYLKNLFYQNIIEKNILKNEYKNIIYHILISIVEKDENIYNIDNDIIENILKNKRIISVNYDFAKILDFLKQKNKYLSLLSEYNNKKTILENEFIKYHESFSSENINLQHYLLSNEVNKNIIEKNALIKNLEEKIANNIEIIETNDNLILTTNHNINLYREKIQNELLTIIQYYS